jgi:hypothetical protein
VGVIPGQENFLVRLPKILLSFVLLYEVVNSLIAGFLLGIVQGQRSFLVRFPKTLKGFELLYEA